MIRYAAFTTLALAALAVGCAGSSGDGPPTGRNAIAAAACEAYAKGQLEDKAYQLDTAALAASMKPAGDMQRLTAPIVIEPGGSGEVKETLDCKVRFSADGKTADVINLNFIF
jgi:hypothetical protein